MNEIEKLIGIGKVEIVLKLLVKFYPEEKDNWLMLQARWSGLQKDSRMGIITSQNANIQRNQITHATLAFFKEAVEAYGDRTSITRSGGFDKTAVGGIDVIGDYDSEEAGSSPDEWAVEEVAPDQRTVSPIKRCTAGQLFYRIPIKMQVQQMTTCVVRIACDKATLTYDLTVSQNDKITALKRLTDDMSVRLIDPSDGQYFSIKNYGDEVLFIDEDDYTEWTFHVTPLMEGNFPLLLQISVIQLVRGKERKRHITENINIEITSTKTKEEQKHFKKGQTPIVNRAEIPTGTIYFSYAWGDGAETGVSREKIVDELYESLKSDGYEVRRDKKDNSFGDSISQFMDQLGDGDLVLVFTSEKYFKSAYCMYELNELGSRFEYKPSGMRQAILPIPVEFINFKKRTTLATYKRFWKKEAEEWAKYVDEFKDSMSDWEWKEYRFTRDLDKVHFTNLVGVLIDINQSTTKLLSVNNFALVKTAIHQRLAKA